MCVCACVPGASIYSLSAGGVHVGGEGGKKKKERRKKRKRTGKIKKNTRRMGISCLISSRVSCCGRGRQDEAAGVSRVPKIRESARRARARPALASFLSLSLSLSFFSSRPCARSHLPSLSASFFFSSLTGWGGDQRGDHVEVIVAWAPPPAPGLAACACAAPPGPPPPARPACERGGAVTCGPRVGAGVRAGGRVAREAVTTARFFGDLSHLRFSRLLLFLGRRRRRRRTAAREKKPLAAAARPPLRRRGLLSHGRERPQALPAVTSAAAAGRGADARQPGRAALEPWGSGAAARACARGRTAAFGSAAGTLELLRARHGAAPRPRHLPRAAARGSLARAGGGRWGPGGAPPARDRRKLTARASHAGRQPQQGPARRAENGQDIVVARGPRTNSAGRRLRRRLRPRESGRIIPARRTWSVARLDLVRRKRGVKSSSTVDGATRGRRQFLLARVVCQTRSIIRSGVHDGGARRRRRADGDTAGRKDAVSTPEKKIHVPAAPEMAGRRPDSARARAHARTNARTRSSPPRTTRNKQRERSFHFTRNPSRREEERGLTVA